MPSAITLITGPTRSGKSEFAEQLATRTASRQNQQIIYIATAQNNPEDPEWQARIDQHRQRRPDSWQIAEVAYDLSQAIAPYSDRHCLLIDSLGTWCANFIESPQDEWDQAQEQLLQQLSCTEANVILVAEETGWGIVPAYALGRLFRDRLGSLSRAVGALATEVHLVTCGYALNLSQLGQPIGHSPAGEEHS